jgi:hypothetical protein
MIMNKMMSNFYMLSSKVLGGVFDQIYSTSIIINKLEYDPT